MAAARTTGAFLGIAIEKHAFALITVAPLRLEGLKCRVVLDAVDEGEIKSSGAVAAWFSCFGRTRASALLWIAVEKHTLAFTAITPFGLGIVGNPHIVRHSKVEARFCMLATTSALSFLRIAIVKKYRAFGAIAPFWLKKVESWRGGWHVV